MKLLPMQTTLGISDIGAFATMKQAAQILIDVSNFVKELFLNPMGLLERGVHGLQVTIEPTILVILAVIILLKMIGFKDMEKWGILSLIVYVVIMVL